MGTNTAGWSLTGRLIASQFGALGSSLASMIAGFDPVTATRADRDALSTQLRGVAIKYAQAKAVFDKEHATTEALRAQIAADQNVIDALSDRLAKGEITEAIANAFIDEFQREQASLPEHVETETGAKQFMDEILAIQTEMSNRLAAFDEQAEKALRELSKAQSQLDVQRMRASEQDELRQMQGGVGTPSSAMAALQKRAADMGAQAEALKVVTDVGNRPAQAKADMDALRASVSSGTAAPLSAMDRLKALSSKPVAA